MRWSSWPAVALLGAALLGCSGAPANVNAAARGAVVAAPESAEALAFAAAHNRARAAADPPADPPLQPLRWSEALAAHAAQVAASCEFEHSQGTYGENIAARKSAAGTAATVDAWVGERANWDAAENRCAAGKVCTHYTQVVWRGTRELGCASRICTSGGPFGPGPWYFAVCNYAPAGNLSGERPY